MEEIIGLGIWLEKNKDMLYGKYPKLINKYKDFSTEGFSFAVFEELCICIIICLFTSITKMRYGYYFWLGSFIAFTLHFIIHIIQVFAIRKYIPALITSIICLPISIIIIRNSIVEMNCKLVDVLIFSIIGILFVGINLKFAQSLIGKFTRKIKM